MAPKYKYKLTYFALMGIGEPLRFILAYTGEDFEDFRFSWEEWPNIKPNTPFGKVPVLEIDGGKLTITQSVPICRYLGRQIGIAGKDALEDLNIDRIVDIMWDMRPPLDAIFQEKDEKLKTAKKETCLRETLPFYMNRLEAIAKENNGFLANGKLSWADIYFAGVTEYFSIIAGGEITNPYPTLKALKQKVLEFPKIKAYVAQRPKTDI